MNIPIQIESPVLCTCTGTDKGHSVDGEVLEYRNPVRGVRDRILVSLLDLWAALPDKRLEGLLLDVVGVFIVVIITFPFFLLLFVSTP